MVDLIGLFKEHIDDLFDPDSEYESNGVSKIRVDQPNPNSRNGFKSARSVVLDFDKDVIDVFRWAKGNQLEELNNYKFSLRRLVMVRLQEYGPDGDKSAAFKIHIDSRATAL